MLAGAILQMWKEDRSFLPSASKQASILTIIHSTTSDVPLHYLSTTANKYILDYYHLLKYERAYKHGMLCICTKCLLRQVHSRAFHIYEDVLPASEFRSLRKFGSKSLYPFCFGIFIIFFSLETLYLDRIYYSNDPKAFGISGKYESLEVLGT